MLNSPSQDRWRLAGEALHLMFGKRRPVKFESEGAGWLLATGEPSPDLNCGLIDDPREGERALFRFLQKFRDLKVPFLICFTEEAAGFLTEAASRYGLVSIGELPLMIRPGRTPWISGKPEIETKIAETEEDLSIYQGFAATEFGLPDKVLKRAFPPTSFSEKRVRFLLGYLDGDLVGVAACTVHPQEEAGYKIGIWSMTTAPDHRRKGIASALLAQIFSTFDDAEEFYLLSTTDGEALYERAGFEKMAIGQVFAGRYA